MTTDNEGNSDVDALDEQALARYFEERREDDSGWQKTGRKIRGRRGPSTVFQMRLAPEELEEIARAAAGNVSEFVRTAALEKARSQADGDQTQTFVLVPAEEWSALTELTDTLKTIQARTKGARRVRRRKASDPATPPPDRESA